MAFVRWISLVLHVYKVYVIVEATKLPYVFVFLFVLVILEEARIRLRCNVMLWIGNKFGGSLKPALITSSEYIVLHVFSLN